MTPLDPNEIRLRGEIHQLKKALVELTKKNIALKVERDTWRQRFEKLSVSKIKTVRIKVDEQEK